MRENKPENRWDWSTRHVRLRFEILACSFVIFLLGVYGLKLKPSVLLPIDLTVVSEDHAIIGLTVVYFFLLGAFIVRSLTEQAFLKLEEALPVAELASERNRFSDLLRTYDPDKTSDKLDALITKLPQCPTGLSAAVAVPTPTSDLAPVMNALVNIKAVIPNLVDYEQQKLGITAETIGNLSGDIGSAIERHYDYLRRAIEQYEKAVLDITTRLETERSALSEVRAAAATELQQLSDFYRGDGIMTGMQSINESVNELSTRTSSIISQLSRWSGLFHIERNLISFLVPATVSVALMVFSHTKILAAFRATIGL